MNRPTERRRRDAAGFTLLELMVVCALLTVVLGIVSGFLIASNNAVATAAVRLGDTGDARAAAQEIGSTVQFATSLTVGNSGQCLYAVQQNGSTDEWKITGGNLVLVVGSHSSTVVRGVTSSGALFKAATSATTYTGLVSVRFTVQENTKRDKLGTPVDSTFVSEDASGVVGTQSTC